MSVASDEDDRTLVERVIRSKDERAFSVLYDRYTTRMYRMALALCGGDSFTAEDIVHDAWTAAVPRLGHFRWQSKLLSWLLGFVVNIARSHMRAIVPGASELVDAPVDDRELQGTFDRLDLTRALSTLALGYREVLVLHDIEGFTHEEISEMLGISVGGSKSQLSRARATMRRLLIEPGVPHA